MNDKDVDIYRSWQSSPIKFIGDMWGLVPQPIKPEFKEEADKLLNTSWDEWEEAKPQFKPYWFEEFEKGKHITWQQWLILVCVEKAINKQAKKHISIVSGHGIGKSGTLAWLALWFLFCFMDAQVPCTAPTSAQMHDILWKEINLWLGRMPAEIRELYIWQREYVRIKERPDTWFARAKTADKEKPEALAGVHGDNVLMEVDEASGVPEEIFNTAEGALTNENIIFIQISNGTRTIGYFYDSHHKYKEDFQTLSFSSEESPIVEEGFVEKIIKKHGRESDEFKIRVGGGFPGEDAIDNSGYMQLIPETDIRQTDDEGFVGRVKMGIDPSGEGKDTTDWVIRDRYRAKMVASEKVSNKKTIAQKTLTLMSHYNVKPEDVWCDNFGVGANVAQELALAEIPQPDGSVKGIRINSVNWGEEATDKARYINKRAECSYRFKEALQSGFELVRHENWKECKVIKYRRELTGKISIMPKRLMRKMGIKSPNTFDATALTFYEKDSDKPEDEVDYDYESELRPKKEAVSDIGI